MGKPLDAIFLELGEGGVPFRIYMVFCKCFLVF